MVIKGKARGGPVALAAHLERRDTNERVTVLELRGVTARDVLGALREMDCMGSGAASIRTLYHAAINSAPDERLTAEQKQKAADRLEKEMGFEGQPRIIVEHFKKDREHMHVVFLRIDTERMVAIPDSHNYRKHEIVARDLEREFGHERVQGVHVGRDGNERPSRTPYHHEMQQAERTGLTPQQIKERVTELWRQADSGKAFAASVAADGWVLAKGDSRDFVLVDQAGGTHSLSRRIEGAKAADIRQRLSDLDPASLPSVAEAKERQRTQAETGRTKEIALGTEKAKAPNGPVLLQVNAPQAKSPAAPLELAASAGQESRQKPIQAPPEKQSKQIEPRSAAKNPKQNGPFKRLYAAAIEKARGLIQTKKELPPPIQKSARKPAARPTPPPKPAHIAEKPTPQLTPTQEAMRLRRAEAKAADKKLMRDSLTEHPKEPPALEQSQTRERKHKLSREEIDMLWERQRRQRDRSGPSR